MNKIKRQCLSQKKIVKMMKTEQGWHQSFIVLKTD